MTTEIAKTDNDFLIDIEKMTARLNIPPDQKILRNTPDGKAKYIPVSIIETELRKDFFGLVQFEIKSERRELNEYIICATIKVFHPVIRQWLSFDGIGAVQIMQKKDSDLSSFTETKIKNALQLNAPKAYAEAIKNAAKKIGEKYGANLNRKAEDVLEYEPDYTISAILEEIVPQFAACNNLDELSILWDSYPELQRYNKFKMAFTKRKSELK